MIDQTRLRGRAAGVTPLKIFVMCSQLFVTPLWNLATISLVNSHRNQLQLTGNKQCKQRHQEKYFFPRLPPQMPQTL